HLVTAQRRDVLDRTVGPGCHDAQRFALAAAGEEKLAWRRLQRHRVGVAFVDALSTRFNPSPEKVVLPASDLHPPTAAVLVLVRWLEQHEALRRSRNIGARLAAA